MLIRPLKGGEDRRWTSTAIAACGALGIVLILLAVVQYRQVAELRQAERRQLDLSLRATAERFAADFSSELLRVAAAFRAEHVAELDTLAAQIEEGYEQWLGITEYPQLIRAMLVVRPDDVEGGRVWEFQYQGSGPGSLSLIDWPERLSAAKEPLRRYAGASGMTATRPQEILFMEAGPALAIPFAVSNGKVPAWLVAELNAEFIAKALLPRLADSYFGGEDSPYRVGIISARQPRTVIYSSSHFTSDDIDSADLVVNLPAHDDGGDPTSGRTPALRIAVKEIRDGPRWQLAVKHKKGSLDAAVDSLRRQNLFVAAAVLIVLAASGGLVIVSAGRTRRLARMQMEMAASMSHELRTPLAVIRAAAYNLKEGVVADRDGVQRYGTLVQDAGRRLSKAVDQFLLFAETQSDPGKIELTSVNISDAVDRAVEAVCAALPDRNTHIQADVPSGLPDVLADPVALSHCVQNLIINGLKHGGSAEDKPVQITAATGGNGREIEILVSDCGPGIQRRHLRHIFKPFYRAHATSGGAGIGLALVGRLMETQGGRISVRTAPGKGTTFVLHLPLAS